MDRGGCHRPQLTLLAAAILSMLLFWLLYRVDNKYTWSAPQPIAGLLILDESALEQHPLQFPLQQWEFYPGALLSPEQLERGGAEVYRQHVFIGQYSGLNAGNPGLPRQGQGSYRLNISVPAGEREYALELPEVYSACRLYINGRLALSLGEVEAGGDRPEIRSRIVTFLAADRIELVLAVSNYAHYTGGLTYPPAFGAPSAVQGARDARLMIRAAVCLLALFVAVFALWAGLRLRWPHGLLFALLCLCFISAAGYPLLHAFFSTGVQPWYTVELVCHYALFALAVALHNSLCGIRGRAGRLSLLPLAAFCLLALAYGLGAATAGSAFVQAFSALSAVFKLSTAGWLLASALWAARRRAADATPMLIATAVYAASLLADRLWPLYEPVYGGWFAEIGGTALVVALAGLLWADFLDAYRFRAAFAEERRYLTRQLELQRSHYQLLAEEMEETRFLRHDLRHHIHALRGLLERGEDLRGYLEQLEPKMLRDEPLRYTAHPAADAVLRHFAARAGKQGAGLEIELDLPAELPFPSDELCIVLGNLLENAAEALERQREGEKFLYLKGRLAEGRLALVMENSFDGQVRQKGGRYYSHKRSGFGLGLESIRSIAERHGGLCDFEARSGTFHVSVMIPVGG